MALTPKTIRKLLQPHMGKERVFGEGCDCHRLINAARLESHGLVLYQDGDKPYDVKKLRVLLSKEEYGSATAIKIEGCDGCFKTVVAVSGHGKNSVLLDTEYD